MANQYATVAAPLTDGVGASVDLAPLSPLRTYTLGEAPFFGTLVFQVSMVAGLPFEDLSPSPSDFGAVNMEDPRFDSGAQRIKSILGAFRFLRIRRFNTTTPSVAAPAVSVGAEEAGPEVFGQLAVPAGDGVAAGSSVTLGGDVLTVMVSGEVGGLLFIEGSEDNEVTYAPIEDFGNFEERRVQTVFGATFTHIRVRRRQTQSPVQTPVVQFGSMGRFSSGVFPGFGSIVSVDKSPNVDGISGLAARADHKHDVVTAVASSSVDIGDAAAEGVAVSLARSDHQHAVPAPAAVPPPVAAAGSIGVATTPARSDHTHVGVTSVDGNSGALTTAAPVNVDKSANAIGAAATLSRSDHKHDVTTAAPTAALDIGDAAAEGVAVSLARSDHQHAFPAPAGAPPAIAAAGAVGVATTPARSDHTHQGVTSVNGGFGTVFGVFDKQFWADSLEVPDNADWPVNALAPSVADTVEAAEIVARFDDTIDEARGFTVELPAGTASLLLRFVSWAETAPAAARTVGLQIQARRLENGAAIPAAFAAALVLADVAIPASRNVVYSDYTVLYTDFATDLVAGNVYHFSFNRRAPAAGTELVGDWDLRGVRVGFGG